MRTPDTMFSIAYTMEVLPRTRELLGKYTGCRRKTKTNPQRPREGKRFGGINTPTHAECQLKAKLSDETEQAGEWRHTRLLRSGLNFCLLDQRL